MKLARYEEIAAELRKNIFSGILKPGSKISPERELCGRFNASRVTLRQALALLEHENLLQRFQGNGTYVSPNPARKIPLMIDYAGSMRAHAPKLKRKAVVWKWILPARDVAAKLTVNGGETLFYAERVDQLDNVTVAWDQAYIVKSFASRLNAKDLSKVDFVETWTKRECFKVLSCEQTVEAVAACGDSAKYLGMKAGTPILLSSEIYKTERNRPAGLFLSRYNPEFICIASNYAWPN